MPIFIPPALLYGGLAAIGAGGRFLNANPQIVRSGQNVIKGGINLLNKAGQSPWLTNLANRFTYGYAPNAVGKSGKVGNLFSQISFPGGMLPSNPMSISGLENIKEGIEFPQEVAEDLGIDDKNFWREQFDKLLSKDKKEDKKENKKEDKKKKKKETKKEKNEEPSIDNDSMPPSNWMDELIEDEKNLKKGGYVKKQRKRKHYKTSGFVKMKKKKKRKYIKE